MWKDPPNHVDLRLKTVLKGAVRVVDEANKHKTELREGDLATVGAAIIDLEARLRSYGCYIDQ